ncbi:MAG: hypothetical protein ACKORC_06545, partial [Acidimicrobiia bacterium]
ALEAPRGTLVLLDGAQPHLSGPNRGDTPRPPYPPHASAGAAHYLEDTGLQRPPLPRRGCAGTAA